MPEGSFSPPLLPWSKIPPLKAYPSQTNFVFVEVGPKEKLDLVYNWLIEQGILVQIIHEPTFSTSRYFLRITVGKEEENNILIEGLKDSQKYLLK